MTDLPHPPSPCTNRCLLDSRTGVCTGCGRTLDEIERWGTMSAPEKAAVLRRIGKDTDGETSGEIGTNEDG